MDAEEGKMEMNDKKHGGTYTYEAEDTYNRRLTQRCKAKHGGGGFDDAAHCSATNKQRHSRKKNASGARRSDSSPD